jgi:hypothetical protein
VTRIHLGSVTKRVRREEARVAEVRGGLFHLTWRGWRLEVPSGAVIPFPYGIAYRDVDSRVGVCVPIPFNWLLRWTIAWLTWIRFPDPERGLDRLFREAYRKGYEMGYQAGLGRASEMLSDTSSETLIEILLERMQQGARQS